MQTSASDVRGTLSVECYILATGLHAVMNTCQINRANFYNELHVETLSDESIEQVLIYIYIIYGTL